MFGRPTLVNYPYIRVIECGLAYSLKNSVLFISFMTTHVKTQHAGKHVSLDSAMNGFLADRLRLLCLLCLLRLLRNFLHVFRLSLFGCGSLCLLLLPFECLHFLLVALRDPAAHLLLARQHPNPGLFLQKGHALAPVFGTGTRVLFPYLRKLVAFPSPQPNTASPARKVSVRPHATPGQIFKVPLLLFNLFAHTFLRFALLHPFASFLQDIASLGLAELLCRSLQSLDGITERRSGPLHPLAIFVGTSMVFGIAEFLALCLRLADPPIASGSHLLAELVVYLRIGVAMNEFRAFDDIRTFKGCSLDNDK